MSDDEIDAQIASYRRALVAEADLARGDLDEIEDHLRLLTDELRAGGMPAAIAVAEAARRLGDPREVAREHARVRTPFGGRLSRLRAWSSAALFVPMLWSQGSLVQQFGMTSRFGVELAMALVMLAALVARISWVRPILLGVMASAAINSIAMFAMWPEMSPLWIVGQLGIVAFLAPWRRRELTAPGIGLALAAWTYTSVVPVAGLYVVDGPLGPIATAALLCSALAVIGMIVRARWAAIACSGSALAIGAAIYEVGGMTFWGDGPQEAYVFAHLAAGLVAATISAVVAWRTARSGLGTLAYVLR